LENAVHRAVAECHVPFVAIPEGQARRARLAWLRVGPTCPTCPTCPPISRSPPWACCLHDAAAGEAAAIGRDTHGTAVAHRDGGGHWFAATAESGGDGGRVGRPTYPPRPTCPPTFRSKRPHLERARPVRVDRRGRADAVLPHQRAEPREKRGELLGRR